MAAIRIVLIPPVVRRARCLQQPRRVAFSCAWLPPLSIAPDTTCDHWTFVEPGTGDKPGDGRRAADDAEKAENPRVAYLS